MTSGLMDQMRNVSMNRSRTALSRPDHATWRAIALGLLLSIPHGLFSTQTYSPTTVSLMYPAVLNLILLVVLNLALKRWLSKIAFSQGELLTIYTMISLAIGIAGTDFVQVLAPILGHAFWGATPENEWQSLFFRYLPRWLIVSDLRVLEGVYEGDSSLYNWDYVRTWLTPVFWWAMFLFALMIVMLGINTIIRKQWMENEKLAYPIIQLPLAIARDGGSARFFRSRLLWIGIAIGGSIDLINGLHTFFPAVPLLPVRNIELGHYFTEKPLSALGWTPVCFFPFVIGLSYFMPLDLAFSCWFLYLVWKLEFILGTSMGLRSLPAFPYVKPQSSGAFLAIAVIAIWSGRKHLYFVLRCIFSGPFQGDSEEPMPYRTALSFIVVGVAFVVLFCVKAGMSLWVIAIFFGFYFLLLFALTRLRAELGPPVNELYNLGPDKMLPQIFGTRKLGAPNLTMFAMFWGINRAHRCNPMPYQLEAFKMVEESQTNYKRLISAMAMVSILGIWVAFWGHLHARYQYGHSGWSPGLEAYRQLERWLFYMPGQDRAATGFMGGGFMFVLILAFLRHRLLWWPLHPVAYPLASSWTMNWMWFPIFISWLIKRTLLRHGGISAYRKAIPFFLGLALGDYSIGGMWDILGVALHRYVYKFWH